MKSKFCLLLVLQFFSSARAIFDGNKVNITHLPFITYLKGPRFFCSGAIISNQHVLTAAHCLVKDKPVKVIIGLDNFYEDSPNALTIVSNKTWIHEKFSLPSAVHDIGIIELPRRIAFSKSVQPIKISTKRVAENDINDLEVVISGFGYPSNLAGMSSYLRYARMKLISLQECQRFKDYYIEDLNKNHICMTSIKGQACDGDSGSPVVSTKTRELVGIISYIKDAVNGISINYNDCEAIVPNVATRISSYLDWISEKTGIRFD